MRCDSRQRRRPSHEFEHRPLPHDGPCPNCDDTGECEIEMAGVLIAAMPCPNCQDG